VYLSCGGPSRLGREPLGSCVVEELGLLSIPAKVGSTSGFDFILKQDFMILMRMTVV
jgi:hypothetical protein